MRPVICSLKNNTRKLKISLPLVRNKPSKGPVSYFIDDITSIMTTNFLRIADDNEIYTSQFVLYTTGFA